MNDKPNVVTLTLTRSEAVTVRSVLSGELEGMDDHQPKDHVREVRAAADKLTDALYAGMDGEDWANELLMERNDAWHVLRAFLVHAVRDPTPHSSAWLVPAGLLDAARASLPDDDSSVHEILKEGK